MAKVNGVRGVLSHSAPGIILEGDAAIDLKSRYNVEAFEFLVGNYDVAAHNINVDSDGKLQLFDHGEAWKPGVPRNDQPHKWSRGLPQFYTPEFVESLRFHSEDSLIELLRPHLTQLELNGFLLRRKLLLTDFQTRPQAVIN